MKQIEPICEIANWRIIPTDEETSQKDLADFCDFYADLKKTKFLFKGSYVLEGEVRNHSAYEDGFLIQTSSIKAVTKQGNWFYATTISKSVYAFRLERISMPMARSFMEYCRYRKIIHIPDSVF